MLRVPASSSLVEAIGALLVVIGLSLWSVTVAVIAGGVMLIVAAQLMDRQDDSDGTDTDAEVSA